MWYPKNRTDLNIIHEENEVIETMELARVKAQLKQGKHTCLIMRMEPTRFVEFYNRTVIRPLSRNYKTPIKRLQDSYQEITALL